MGTTYFYEYQCKCGNVGKYSKHSSDWFFRLFGMGTSGPPKCLSCDEVICDNCRKGKLCEKCNQFVPNYQIFICSIFNIIAWISLIFTALWIAVFNKTDIFALYFIIGICVFIISKVLSIIFKILIKNHAYNKQ